MSYAFFVTALSLILIYKIAPKYGKQNILVYVSICSLVGSISVMAVKGFGVALKLTFEGNNQLVYPSTYVFALVVGVSAITQMNYFNKALDIYSTNLVTPLYYVFFTSATILASVVLFQGFNESSGKDVVSVFSGFFTIFMGVFLLNSHKGEASPVLLEKHHNGRSILVSESHMMTAFDEENLGLALTDEEDD